jgi:putative MFS transporter
MTNLGPSSHTYLIAGEVFPTEIRATGAGFAAAVGKVGAVAAAYFFPTLILQLGPSPLLYILAGTSLLGALVTLAVRIETAGVRLDKIGQEAGEPIAMPGPVTLTKRSLGASSE